MLVLSRKEQESIAIGDDIKLTVISCNKGRMRIGIEAPKETRIVRSELKEKDRKMESEQRLATILTIWAFAAGSLFVGLLQYLNLIQ